MVCIVGKKNSGKTTTVVALAAELRRRGHRVMTIKHGHHFDLDREGTDSFRHRVEGGAERVVLAGPGQFSLAGSWPENEEIGPELLAQRYLPDADVVVVEGFKSASLPKVEVFRRAAHRRPVWDVARSDAADYIAGVTDDDEYARTVPFPVLRFGDPEVVERLGDIVEEALRL